MLSIQNFATIYSGKKKKVNGPKGAKYIFPVERGKFFVVLRYQYSLGKKNYLTIIGKILFTMPGPLTLFSNVVCLLGNM